MSAGTASLCSTLLYFSILVFVSAEKKIITAESGDNVILPCQAPHINMKIIVVKWSRADLGDKYVLLYRNGNFAPATQHPFFKNRVELLDRQMKDGDVSFILKDVTINDAGTYKCHVFMEGAQTWKVSSIYLRVIDPPEQKTIPAGQDVILPCRAPNTNKIIVVEWSRADLVYKYVLLYRDEHFNHHPSFKNRVVLLDRQMKDGDVSLILKDVTINDAGTYECRVVERGMNRRKRAILKTQPIHTVNLTVIPPGQP
ncbi:V-set domain-containing T-cell activation inhibitor 1-like [Oreochromis aureus]|uniref:V-set domain-containing T-cell activation inhibitor 1-like n=1 Tax=Oreochromis aureus TaxID=47969 RepID=UPI001954CDFF|nr:V-set domain-containing T-cell activation inhibitor 1-like [Oreochromis aureus]